MHISIARHAALAVALAFPGLAHAQPLDPEPSDGSILVTTSRTGDRGGLTIADAETIERRQPTSLLEVLNDLPGVRATSLGGPAGQSFLSIRGGEGNFTAVVIDGIRLNDPTNTEGGAFDFTLLDPAAVARVEVARTAGSAIHGSDALSGVVQIVTRDPSADGLDLDASGWLDSRYGAAGSARLSGGWGSGGLLGSIGHYDSGDGDPAGMVRRNQTLVRGRQAVGSFHVNAIGLYTDSHGSAFPQDSGGPLLAVVRTRETRDGDLALVGASLTRTPVEPIRPSLTLSYALQHHDSDSPAIASGLLDGVPATLTHTRFARFEATSALAADLGPLTLAAGGAILREDGRSDGTLDFGFPVRVAFALTRVTHSGFAEASVRPSAALTLTGAARYDRLSGGGGNWTGRGAIRWQAAPDRPSLSVRIANGYKRPSFYALGHPLIGNPALKPETGRSIDVGFEWPLPNGRVVLTLFDNQFRNLVDFDPLAFQLTNRARVGAQGAELAAQATLGEGWSFGAALAHVSLDSATPLRGRPGWTGNARLTWQRGRWEATVAARGNSRFNDSSIPTGPWITPGHVEADAGVRFALRNGLAVQISVLNLGDDRSWDAVGTPSPGRSIRIGLALD